MKSILRILHLEDEPNDVELVRSMLEAEDFSCDITQVETRADFITAIEKGKFDLILADYALPAFDGMSALEIQQEKCPGVPFIFLSGKLGEELAIDGLKRGATDYVLKQRMARLVPSVHRALSEAREHDKRMQTEEALRLREQQLRLIYDSTGDILYYLKVEPGPHYRFLTVNSAFLKSTGLRVEQIVGKTINEVIPKPSLKLVRSNYEKAIRQKRIMYWEETSQYPVGLKTGIVSIAPVFDDKGNCTHLVGSVHDITERKKLESSLVFERDKFNFILQELPIGVSVLDADHKFTYINPISMQLDSYPEDPQSILGKHVIKVHPEQKQPKVEQLLHDFKSGEKSIFTREAKRGKRTIEISYHALRGSQEKYMGLVRLVSDITKRKLAEQALRDSEYLLRESQRVANLGSYSLDIPSGIWKSSPILDEVFGIDKKYDMEISGWLQIVHPEDRAMMQDYFVTNVLTNHESFNKEYRIKRINDQQERWVHGLGELEFDDEGKPVKMIGTIQDITERKQAEEKLRDKMDKLERFNRVVVDRELRMIELKEEINTLLERAGLPKKYKSADNIKGSNGENE